MAPISSHFAPSYGMACALLRRHAGSLERCQRLVERSFGSYLARRGVTKESDVDTYLKLVNEAQLRADAYEKLFDDPKTSVDVLAGRRRHCERRSGTTSRRPSPSSLQKHSARS